MESKNGIRKTARIKDDKEKLFQLIIDTGRNLFVSRGSQGFKTRELAKLLKMSPGNLYNYVKSKRELYIAIRIQDIQKLKDDFENIVKEHSGNYISLFQKIIEYYLDFAKFERRKFQMLFTIPAPPSKIIGPIEKNYKLIDPLSVIKRILKEGIDAKEIKNTDVDDLAYYLYATVHGAAHVERELGLQKKILEPLLESPNQKIIEKFRNNLIQRIIKELQE